MGKIRFTKEQMKMINPYDYHHHFVKTSDWIKQSFEIQCDKNGEPIKLPAKPIIDENGNLIQQDRYKIKRKAELWMIAMVVIMDLELSINFKSVASKKTDTSFAFYGSYKAIRNVILNSVDSRLVPQLSQSITIKSISTSMKRAEASGFIKIEYDHTVTRKTCTKENNYRKITLCYDKLLELNYFETGQNKASYEWRKYHSSSREHRWMRKRPVSYLKPLIEDLSKKEKKEEFKQKLLKLKLKLKTEKDVLKAFILTKQKNYINSYTKDKLTAVKSNMEEADNLVNMMYQNVDNDTGEFILSENQRLILEDFYQRIG